MYDAPISYSGKSLFKECPKRWEDNYIRGNRPPSGKAAERGTKLHDELETFFKGTPYPRDNTVLAPWRRFMEALTIYLPTAEGELAVTADWKPCSFDDPKAFYRGKADLFFNLGGILHILDWKSGRKYDTHEDQGKSYVAMSPEHDSYRTGFVYLDHPLEVLEFEYTQTEREDHIAELIKEVNGIRTATEYPATPSDKACQWCPLSWRKGGECKSAR